MDSFHGEHSVDASFQEAQKQPEEDLLQRPRSYIFESRVEAADQLREAGNACFALQRYQDAIDRYDRALYQIEFDEAQLFEFQETHVAQLKGAELRIRLNKALTLIKMAEDQSEPVPSAEESAGFRAFRETQAALKLDEFSFKARSLKCKALLSLKRNDEAVDLCQKLVLDAPNDTEKKATSKLLFVARKAAAEDAKRQKDLWHGKLNRSGVDPAVPIEEPRSGPVEKEKDDAKRPLLLWGLSGLSRSTAVIALLVALAAALLGATLVSSY